MAADANPFQHQQERQNLFRLLLKMHKQNGEAKIQKPRSSPKSDSYVSQKVIIKSITIVGTSV